MSVLQAIWNSCLHFLLVDLQIYVACKPCDSRVLPSHSHPFFLSNFLPMLRAARHTSVLRLQILLSQLLFFAKVQMTILQLQCNIEETVDLLQDMGFERHFIVVYLDQIHAELQRFLQMCTRAICGIENRLFDIFLRRLNLWLNRKRLPDPSCISNFWCDASPSAVMAGARTICIPSFWLGLEQTPVRQKESGECPIHCICCQSCTCQFLQFRFSYWRVTRRLRTLYRYTVYEYEDSLFHIILTRSQIICLLKTASFGFSVPRFTLGWSC